MVWYVIFMSQTAEDVPMGHAFSLEHHEDEILMRIARPGECNEKLVYAIETWPELGAFVRMSPERRVVNDSKDPVDISYVLTEAVQ